MGLTGPQVHASSVCTPHYPRAAPGRLQLPAGPPPAAFAALAAIKTVISATHTALTITVTITISPSLNTNATAAPLIHPPIAAR